MSVASKSFKYNSLIILSVYKTPHAIKIRTFFGEVSTEKVGYSIFFFFLVIFLKENIPSYLPSLVFGV